MTKEERIKSESGAKIFKALAHPSRLFMVIKLAEKPYCVSELTEMIGTDTSTVSKHLSLLKNAGIVKSRKQGTTIYYSLVYSCIMKVMDCVEFVQHSAEESSNNYLF